MPGGAGDAGGAGGADTGGAGSGNGGPGDATPPRTGALAYTGAQGLALTGLVALLLAGVGTTVWLHRRRSGSGADPAPQSPGTAMDDATADRSVGAGLFAELGGPTGRG